MIKYASQKITKEDINSVIISLKGRLLTQGKLTEKFEKQISKSVNSKFCLAMNSASSALLLACKALDLKKGDIAWTTTNTFAATANAILLCDATLDLVDIDKNTFNICSKKLKNKLLNTKKNKLPKILIVVHYGGSSCDLKEIFKLSKKYNFKIIEDASHAIGSVYNNSYIGSCQYSHITVFSFHAIKIITSCEGGAITTNNKKIFNQIKMMRTNGIVRLESTKFIRPWYYEQKILGYNFRLNEVQAALGLSQIKRLKLFIKYRNKIANFYRANLKNLPIKFQNVSIKSISSYHLFTITVNSQDLRNKLYNFLRAKKIETNIVYIPLYRHPIHRKSFKFSDFPNSEKFYKNCLSIPIHMDLSKKHLKFITNSITSFFNR